MSCKNPTSSVCFYSKSDSGNISYHSLNLMSCFSFCGSRITSALRSKLSLKWKRWTVLSLLVLTQFFLFDTVLCCVCFTFVVACAHSANFYCFSYNHPCHGAHGFWDLCLSFRRRFYLGSLPF